jgi:hypothetical protein
MFDFGLTLTSQAIRRQLAAMPCELYLVRLIHNATQRPFPGERLWTAVQLANLATIRFLRARNCEGCDVYIHPYAPGRNVGYILIDLDDAEPAVLSAMHAHGHEPCVAADQSWSSAGLGTCQHDGIGAYAGDGGGAASGGPVWR